MASRDCSNRIPSVDTRARKAPPFLSILLVIAFASPQSIGQVFRVIYPFSGAKDGSNPYAGLVLDSKGNMYGTTYLGGAHNSGTIFSVSPMGKERVLWSFDGGADGGNPLGGLVRDRAGNLYGTTWRGGYFGNPQYCYPSGCGTIFILTRQKVFSVLYAFQGWPDGASPQAGLVRNTQGTMYGTTPTSVYLVTSGSVYSQLHVFGGGSDGNYSVAALTLDAAGNLYGTTEEGGVNGYGTVFELDKNFNEKTLYSFCSTTMCGDGSNPKAKLILDSSGNLYGTTFNGGDNGYCSPGGCGTVFSLDTAGHLTTLDRFGTIQAGIDPTAGLVEVNGKFYGTTAFGGNISCNFPVGCGVLFELAFQNNAWVDSEVYIFSGLAGEFPNADLIRDTAGNLYGTTAGGGDGHGVVFEFTPKP